MDDFAQDILSITPNTSWDELRPPGVYVPGGGGVSAALTYGQGAGAIGLVGQPDLPAFEEALRACGIPSRFVPVPGPTRILTYEAAKKYDDPWVTRPGYILDQADVEQCLQNLLNLAADNIRRGMWVILSGSLPGGLDDFAYVRLAECATSLGAHVFIDGPPQHVLRAVPLARAFKLNRKELMTAVPGVDTTNHGQLLGAAASFIPISGIAAFTLGADGTVICQCTPDVCHLWHFTCEPPADWPIIHRRCAGDSFGAGFVGGLMQGQGADVAAVAGVAAATANLSRQPGDSFDGERALALRGRVKLCAQTSATRKELVPA